MKKIKEMSVFLNIILPLIPMLFWGSLFPFIKIGYKAFNINTSSVPDIIMFAAFRFLICGVIVCVFSKIRNEKIGKPMGKTFLSIIWLGVFSIVLHYAFTYVGLSMTDSSKTALLKQLGVLFYVCFSFLFIKKETFSIYKIVGALVGFCGIIAINTGGGKISFTLGDILIIGASVCTVVSGVISDNCVKGTSPYWVTGISQLFGGIVLLILGLVMGGNMPVFTWKATLVFVYICTASIIGYTLWYYVQKTASLSKLFIIKFAEPLFACLFGAILLGEDIFKFQYLIAFVLISAGIILGDRSKS